MPGASQSYLYDTLGVETSVLESTTEGRTMCDGAVVHVFIDVTVRVNVNQTHRTKLLLTQAQHII